MAEAAELLTLQNRPAAKPSLFWATFKADILSCHLIK